MFIEHRMNPVNLQILVVKKKSDLAFNEKKRNSIKVNTFLAKIIPFQDLNSGEKKTLSISRALSVPVITSSSTSMCDNYQTGWDRVEVML